ncbi:Hypothetical protein SRAE_2000492100 [Strongyloides ratti]|uniref:Uncharacterized protein n=1 Tax=Strongyloides ratti TaxID=34506 RepID=A0A090LKQ5_STRRB|nr:Hypothetical protein SRAE_2000492100 [Strongyloides ratti]CEF70288.1 Hypothetical protein SRAE_2000492100 [Strongyloides ratti]
MMKESVEIMISTILGDSIHEIFDSPDYTNQIKCNLYKIILLILKFSILVNSDEHILLFKKSFENITIMLLKFCLIENIPTSCFDVSYYNDYRSKLIYMKSILLSLQSKYSFLLLIEDNFLSDENVESLNDNIV